KGKWASRHRKIEKLGCQAAAKIISFPRRWHGGMISANQEAIWGMSVYSSQAQVDTEATLHCKKYKNLGVSATDLLFSPVKRLSRARPSTQTYPKVPSI
ncbi:MAG: hypothetical protein QGF16_01600, partial [Rhodospirillales bacterium]|nr:hypothetical protein [Rhodospirillales bacterium]